MKKVFKKSIAFVIAALMVFSTLPLTPPISVEAATEAELQSLRNEITLTKVNNLQPETFNANGYFVNDIATGGFDNLLYCSNEVQYGDQAWNDTVQFRPDIPTYVVMAYDGVSNVGFPIVGEVKKSGYSPKVEYFGITNTNDFELRHLWYGYLSNDWTHWPNKNSSSYNEDFGWDASNVNTYSPGTTTTYFNNEIYYKGTGNYTEFYDFFDGTIKFLGKKNNYNAVTFGNTGAKQYVLNYKPIYDIISGNSTNLIMLPTSTGYTNSNITFKGLFEYVNNNPNRFTVDSQVEYYKAVKTICNMKVAGEFIFTNDSTVDANVKTAANVIKNAYNNYNTAVANLVRQYEVKFISNDGTENIKYYPVNTTSSGIVIPENTVNNYDDTKHYSYSWPEITISSLTKDYSFNEIKTEAVHDLNSQIISQATCTDSGSTKYTCDCGYTYTDDSIPAATGHNWRNDIEIPADCTNTGKYAGKTCTICGVTEGYGEIPATGHTEVEIPAVAATCTTDGSTAGTKCSVCGEILTTPTVIPATGSHDYEVIYNPETKSDDFTCKNCGDKYSLPVADKTALNAAIVALQSDLDLPEAGYKYDAARVEAAKELIVDANDIDRYADQSVVDAKANQLKTAQTELNAEENLAKYTITVQVVNSENADDTEASKYGKVLYNQPYGTTFEHSFVFDKIDDGTSMTGLPKYAVYKWTVGDVKLNTTDTSISGVVKGNATYICHLLPFKATNETQTTTRVRYLDKSGKTIDLDTATVGTKYTIKEGVTAPSIPYYEFSGWDCVFGTPDEVGTREIVYKATYTYSDSKANVCEIVGIGDVRVNGGQSCEAIYDSKVVLTGATKYAFCDADGNIISYINEDYIYTPRVNETVYIIAVEEATTATTAITGSFVQKNVGTLKDGVTPYHNLYINAQFYLPEGATAVEAGLVLSKSKSSEEDLQIGKQNVTNLVSTSQSSNHEYSMAMSFTTADTVYARSYLIYVDKNGTTHTVYSAVSTIDYSA